MKIGILTHYGVHNHGALLQAYALRTVLTELGHEVCFLRFARSYEYMAQGQASKYRLSWRSIPVYLDFLRQRGLGSVLYNMRKKRTLAAFRAAHFPMAELAQAADCDAVIIGSDEVFSLEVGFTPCMYGIGLDCPRVLSYAASFGPTRLADVQARGRGDDIAAGLRGLTQVSVRDENSAQIVEALTGSRPALVCDPVILYGYAQEQCAQQVPAREPYILVYAYDTRMNDAREVAPIREFAAAQGLPLYSVGFYHAWCDKCIDVSPLELLGWVRGARYVLTDTFHGSVLSLICQTPMLVKLRDNANKLACLLAQYGLSGRITQDFHDLAAIAAQPVDWTQAEATLKAQRAQSRQYLLDALAK